MRIVFVGPPGSGKGTQARLLQERYGLMYMGTGDLLRDAVSQGTPGGKAAEAFMSKGQLVPDDVVNALVREFFHGTNPPKKFILDGYPRTKAQAEFLDQTLEDAGLALKRVIVFTVPDDELLRRLTGRRLTETRSDDDDATIRKRLRLYHATTEAVGEHYRQVGLLAEISATADIEAIHKQVVALIV